MKSIPEFFQQISLLNSKYDTCIYTTDYNLSEEELFKLSEKHCAIETGNYSNVLLANKIGIDKSMVYFNVTSSSLLHLEKVLGKCRLIVSSLDVLSTINQHLQNILIPDSLESIAIRIIPIEESIRGSQLGIYLNQLPDLSARLKRLNYISVRGIFIVPASMNYSIAVKLKEYFSLIKSIRSWLPCTFSYFCMEHVLDYLSDDTRGSILSSLDLISLLNNTSLYSEFIIS